MIGNLLQQLNITQIVLGTGLEKKFERMRDRLSRGSFTVGLLAPRHFKTIEEPRDDTAPLRPA